MENRIRVSIDWLSKCASQLMDVVGDLEKAAHILEGTDTDEDSGGMLKVITEVNLQSLNRGFCVPNVRSGVEHLCDAISSLSLRVEEIEYGVNGAMVIFDDAEHEIIGMIEGAGHDSDDQWDENAEPFDDLGLYGGNQSHIIIDDFNHDRYREIIAANTGHMLSDEALEIYLNRMASEGCGYMAVCNFIMAAFRGNPEGFERTFGFSMYNGKDLNYNQLFADIYSRWDNRDTDGNFMEDNDFDSDSDGEYNLYDYWADDSGRGLTTEEIGRYAQSYLSQFGVDASAEIHQDVALTADMYNQLMNEGIQQGQVQVCMWGHPAYLYDSTGTKVLTTYDGGHAMTVTGTTGSGENAMLIVSSWGETYYIKPDAYCATDESGATTGSMDYMILNMTQSV